MIILVCNHSASVFQPVLFRTPRHLCLPRTRQRKLQPHRFIKYRSRILISCFAVLLASLRSVLPQNACYVTPINTVLLPWHHCIQFYHKMYAIVTHQLTPCYSLSIIAFSCTTKHGIPSPASLPSSVSHRLHPCQQQKFVVFGLGLIHPYRLCSEQISAVLSPEAVSLLPILSTDRFPAS